MSVSLLDVNILIALAWPSHIHHIQAHTWFAKNASSGWATCHITQCAFVRISSNPKIIPDAVSPREVLELLGQIISQKHHTFWPDDIPLLGKYIPDKLLVGHRQITDAYLLGLAIKNKGKLVTFDKGISSLIPSRSPHLSTLEIIGL